MNNMDINKLLSVISKMDKEELEKNIYKARMNEDFSEVLNKFSDILKEKNIDLNNIMNNSDNSENAEESNNSDFSFDMDTILKMKDIFTAMNKSKDSPRNKLLYSLKPYLENTKKEKLEQYVKIANLLTALESMNNFQSFKNSDYDFILIIILVLLIL